MLAAHPADTAWKGHYVQGGDKYEMLFECVIMDETRIWGKGSDTIGDFELSGTKAGSRVCFTKQYIGQHAVGYAGQLQPSPEGQKIVGMWSIDGEPGEDFELLRSREVEREREAAYKMVVARTKMAVGILRLLMEDVGMCTLQIVYVLQSSADSGGLRFTVASIGAGLVVSIAGPLAEAVHAMRLQRQAGKAAACPPAVDGGRDQTADGLASGQARRKAADTSRADEADALLEDERLEAAKAVTSMELVVGNLDYIEVLMERADVPALVPDVAVTDVICTKRGVHLVLLAVMVAYWAYVVSVPFLFHVTCHGGVPAVATTGFFCIAFVSVFAQLWCAAFTKLGYLTLVHAPQTFGVNMALSLIGLFDSYSDMAFVVMAKDCKAWVWKPAAAVFAVGVIGAQAVPGIAMFACRWNLPAAFKLSEMNLLMSLMKPTIK